MMDEHLDRLRAMANNDGQWDLSENDIAAIAWAVSVHSAIKEIDKLIRTGPIINPGTLRQACEISKRFV